MTAMVKGAKKGNQQPRQPVVAPDSAQSKTYIKELIGLAEGEVEGLANGYQSILLEDTPLQDENGNKNFENVTVNFRSGTNDQEYIEGFPAVENEIPIDVELKSSTPWVRSFNNLDLDAVRLRLRWGPLRNQDPTTGDVTGYTIEYAVDLQTDGGAWSEVLRAKISDKTSDNYERPHRIDLPKADSGWLVRVRRITPNSTSEYISDKMYVKAVTEVIDAKLRYPNTALVSLQYDAETFGGSVAKLAVDLKGVKIKVPTNYNPETREYIGFWDGTFKRAYSNNPAWIYYDLCTSKRYGIGERITDGMLDKWSLYRLAQYCDELVPDGLGGQEPRFTCNIYLQSAEDAYSILTKLAGVFRAITYWDGDSIVCDADIPQDTYFTYTRANIIGEPDHNGTRARDRHNAVKVAWDNPANHYKTEYEFVRDEKAISEMKQVRLLELDAWGCTSRGQAQRAGLWALKSEQLETRTVTFKVGLDGHIPLPGKVIEFADPIFAGRANGGRISAISADRKSITLDRDDVVAIAGDRLVINGENGKAQTRIVQSIVGRVITVTVAFDEIAPQNVWVIDAQDLATLKFRVLSVVQSDSHQFTITALEYNPKKFDAIDHGAHYIDVPISIVNPNIQEPVSNIVITSEDRVDQGINVATMVVSWTQAKGAVKYLVEWRKDDGSWIKLPITGNNSIELPGIYAGNYQAKVTAVNASDISSLPTYSVVTKLNGKQGLPPALAFIQATGILFGMRLNWGFPATGALDTAYTEIQVSPDGTSNIAQLGLFAYPTTTHTLQGLQPNLTQFYRGRLIDRIGNIGPWSDWTHATTSADATDVLELLNDQISETQLSQDLKTKIDHIETIDAEIGPLKQDIQNTKDRITQEVIDRQNAIQQASDGLSQQIIDGDESVLEVVETVKKSSDDGLAAVQEDIRVVADDLSLVAEKTDGVYAQLNPPLIGSESDLIGNDQGFAGTWSVQSAMIEGDLALSKRIDTTAVELNNLQAYAQQEVQARIEGDKVTVQKIDTYIASNDTALATVRESAKTAVEQSAANAESIKSINIALEDKVNTGALDQVKSDVKEVDKKIIAQTTRIDGVYAQLNPPLIGSDSDLIGNDGGYAGVWSEQSARIEGDLAQAIRTDTIQTDLNGNKAAVQEVTKSVNGLYAQKFIKLDVNGKIAGWGGANDGVESQFIFNFDSIAIGNGSNGTVSYPFIFRTTPFTDPVTGTVFPVGAYLKTVIMDYQSVDTSHIKDLAVQRGKIAQLAVGSAQIDNLAVTRGKIADLAVDTLKIADNAVTVPVSAFAEISVGVDTEYVTIQTLAVPSDMGHTVLTFGAVFSFTGYSPKQQVYCRVLKNDQVVFEDLEVHFIEHTSVASITDANGMHNHNGSAVSVSGNTGQDGSHSHSYNVNGTTGSTNAGGTFHSHSFSANGNTNSGGSHSHTVSLNGNVTMSDGGEHRHNILVTGNSRSAGTINISRHDSTGIAGTFKLQLRVVAGGSMNVSQRYIHAMTMRK
ncbi:TPA: phage tail protein [Acinetobacter baumannii]|uniref:TipJ family phage tail tip protein n=1 Tax=Acinetobacter baumannii TaxID=470 RepID=UPI000DE6EFFA|nr:phage tail protein [Acinetobacter baumannii]SSQ63772.1 phage-related protein, tail component [Acinetobacter baumannii]SSR34169.1 phage-related protein, tail component [Acinetobacter baumannii]SSV98891.1 phage-related protein, tail component [Acinetobacter baumannii]HAV2998786.1 phage tail protein [Acinetobacter baumannii]HAV3002661.1 phage tail protein [Acinetobacter baumannii]